MADTRIPSVAALVDTATEWGRRLIRGMITYTRQHGPWFLWVHPGAQRPPLHLPPGWQGQGIIARIASQSMARHVLSAGVPVVNVCTAEIPGIDIPRVVTDLDASARMSFAYLRDRGLRHFAYCGLGRKSYVQRHHRAFVQAVTDAGFSCDTHRPRLGTRGRARWRQRQLDLEAWLCSLPKPVGIVAWAADRGQEVIHACRKSGLLVPDEVAVLAADDDPLLCEACHPPISGIALTSEQIGYEAAATLDRLMQGRRAPRLTVVAPTRVIERQSTETLAMDDRELAQAVAFIRSHASTPIQVADVLREVPLSRRQFERRFQKAMGRTPADEIRRVHMERAKELLLETEMPVAEVAVAAGFGSREYLARIFKAETGLSPLKYRTRSRGQR
jgi:LacI family transcriptional regulator